MCVIAIKAKQSSLWIASSLLLLAMTVSRNARTYGFGKMGPWGDSLKRCWGKWVVWRNENYILANASASEVEGLSPSKKTSEV